MSVTNTRLDLSKLRRRYFLVRLLEISFLASGTVILTYGIAGLLAPPSFAKSFLSFIAGAILFVILARRYNLHKLDYGSLIRYLNSQYPQLKESVDLLLREDGELTSIQVLQKEITLRQFNALYPEIKFPHHLLPSAGIFAACLTVYFVLSAFSLTERGRIIKAIVNTNQEVKSFDGDTMAVMMRSHSISVTPPGYTQLGPFTTDDFNITVPEGSMVQWMIDFSAAVEDVKIHFSARDSVRLTKSNSALFTQQQLIKASGFYQLQWRDKRNIHRSDYYKIEMIADQPPRISITNLPQFTKLRATDDLDVKILSSLTDDYGLKDAHIIATVSKGSGESVKFREESIRFSIPATISGKKVNASLTINLRKLGLESGDELYFYAEAFDNKQPTPNRHRTETFFIALQDTTSEIISIDAGLGVDLMPEYFRSQRQIIIDTEKLLRDKRKLSKQQFNSTSNELGYDQRVLRLRYGQFLGEEADSGIGTQAAGPDETDTKDVVAQFGHQHDTENEHNLVDQKKNPTPGHDHDGQVKDPNEKEDPMKEFVHNHDDTEEATFLIQSVRTKLKAALTLMWDAELYLRLYEPAKSLPYQYKILNLLKEISNDSRIYVHRTGFDPAPLKEDKRLTGDLTEIKTAPNQFVNPSVEKYPDIHKAVLLTERMLQENSTVIAPESVKIFQNAGRELAVLAIEQPGNHLAGLSILKTLSDRQVKAAEMQKILLRLRKILWLALPYESLNPSQQQITTNRLDQQFLKSLQELRHE